MPNLSKLKMLALIATTSALVACGGSGDGSDQGSLSVGVTDAAVDSAKRVIVEFTAIELKPKSGPSFVIELEDGSQQIDLLNLQGMEFEPLIVNEQVIAGTYNWMRLHIVDNECGVLTPGAEDPTGSFIELDDGTLEPLHIPSGSESGLKLNKAFTIAAGGQTDLTIDFDVRKSVTAPTGQDCHFLKPSLRLVDNIVVGHIAGSVSAELLAGDNCVAENVDSPAAVYLYEGLGVTPDDIDAEPSEPLTSALVNLGNGNYGYEIGFVPAGDYTVALTCDADLDDIESDDDDIVFFEASQNVSVTADAIANGDFN